MSENTPTWKSTIGNSHKYASDSKQIIFFLFSIQFLGFFFWGGISAIYPFILEKIGTPTSQITADWSIIYTFALFIGGFFTRVPMGMISDMLSRKQGLLFGTSIAFFSIFGILLSNNIVYLGVLFALLRTGTHIFPLTSRSYSNETNPKKQRRLNGFVLIGTDLASFLGPIILGFFLDISLETLILFSCFILLLSSIVLNFTTPKKLNRKKLSSKKIFTQALSELNKIRKIISIFFVLGFVNGTFRTILAIFPYLTLNMNYFQTELAIGLIQVTAIIFILISGELNKNFGLFVLITSGIIFIFIGALIIVLGGSNVYTFLLGGMILNGGLQININSLVTSVTLTASKETAATCFGMASGMFFLGASFIPIFAGFLFNINPFYPFIFILIVCIVVLYPVLIVKKEYESHETFIGA